MIIKRFVKCNKCNNYNDLYVDEKVNLKGFKVNCKCGNRLICISDDFRTLEWKNIKLKRRNKKMNYNILYNINKDKVITINNNNFLALNTICKMHKIQMITLYDIFEKYKDINLLYNTHYIDLRKENVKRCDLISIGISESTANNLKVPVYAFTENGYNFLIGMYMERCIQTFKKINNLF